MDDDGLQDAGTDPRIERHPLFDGLRIVDPIEGSQFTLLTPGPVEPTICDTDEFFFPVDIAASIRTTAIETPYLVDVWIRDTEGDLIKKCSDGDTASTPPGQYNIEISSAQMKLYLSVEGGVEIEPREDRMRITLSEGCSVTVGVRSLHEQPAATIKTTDDPEDLMAAISAFGSALKTTSCERSFPTLRGHPPLLELGNELDIPESLDIPETGVRIEIPPELKYIYPIASLAYYLGATVETGPEPRLYADGKAFSLTADGDFESTVSRVLKQIVLMDCVTRTEGYYTVDLYERTVIEDRLDLDFKALYEQSLAEQTRTYLSIPYEDISEAIPRWKLTADVIPKLEHSETLPFLADDLALVRCPDCEDIKSRSVHAGTASVADFFGESTESVRGELTRTSRSYRSENAEREQPFEEQVFRPPPADSIEQTYIGEGIPLGASKMTIEAFQRRLDYTPVEDARTSVVVVCNEEEMNDENIVSEIYGTREWLEFDITIRENLTTEEMESVLRTDADFLHYIGHVDEEGIRCEDGWLDTNDLSEVNVSTFLLNACKSYSQGRGLVEAGSIGGIVTTTDVLDATATKIGRTVARFLDNGFSLQTTLELLEFRSIIANHYLIVGDGNIQVVESRSGVTHHANVFEKDEYYLVKISFYPNKQYKLGTMSTPYLPGNEFHYLAGGSTEDYRCSQSTLQSFLDSQVFPVVTDSGLEWSDTFVC